MSEVCISMPRELTAELIRAVRNNPLCECETKDEMHIRIGWLICAYDAMVAERQKAPV